MEISKEKFKKLGVSAIIAAVGVAALFQLGSIVNDKVYDINAEQYFSEQTVKYGSVTDFKIDSLLRAIDKKVAAESEWETLPSEAKHDVKKIKEMIKSDDFRQMVQSENFYRAAETAVNFGLSWDLSAYNFNPENKKVEAFNNFKANLAQNYEYYSKNSAAIDSETLNHEDKMFTSKVDLTKVKEAHDEDLFATNAVAQSNDPLEFSKVKNRIEQIRTQNQEASVSNKVKPS